ncbi:hypothetical protein BDZ89DRAFT_1133105 [Hymenopellis radicata]|nr:hypothetical protein BDZ89DRAFT_1133105 [Hymenopellis radicata]
MNTRHKKFVLPPGLEKRTRAEITATNQKKQAAKEAEHQQRDAEEAERLAEQQAAKKRVAKFEDAHAATKKANQTLRPDQLPVPLVPIPQTAANTVTVGSTLPSASLDAEEEMVPDKPDINDIDEGMLPGDDLEGPPTSESEAGFGFGLGDRDNSSTDDFGQQYASRSDRGEDAVVASGGGEQEWSDYMPENEGSVRFSDVDMASSGEEYVEEEGDGSEDEDEDEEDDGEYDEPDSKGKRKPRPSGTQPTSKKSRQKSNTSTAGLDPDDPVVQQFMAFLKMTQGKKKKAEVNKKKKAERQIKKSSIRTSTQQMRNVAPSKPTVAPVPKSQSSAKTESKAKKTAVDGGIKKNWRANLYAIPGPPASSTVSLAKSAHTSGDEQEPGAFDQDESQTTQAAARLAQAGGVSRRSKIKEEDDVKLVPADVAEIDGKERGSGPAARATYAKRDLPVTSPTQLVNWDKDVVPFLLVWAGTHSDPFNANADSQLRVKLSQRWIFVFPKLPSIVEFKGQSMKREEHPAIYSVAFQALRTWRSKIGKNAVLYLSQLWEHENMIRDWNTIERKREFVALYLEKNAFAYEDGFGDKRTGSFRGALLLESFCHHVRYLVQLLGKNLAEKMDYFERNGFPVGAMAVCFVAVKRSLKLWENGYLIDGDANAKKAGKKPRTTAAGFNNDPWGKEARIKVIPLVKNLKPVQWADIFRKCEALIAANGGFDSIENESGDEGAGDGAAAGDDEPEMVVSD